MPFYTLEAGRLIRPRAVVTEARAKELVQDFIAKFASDDDRIVWTSPNAKSELVVHPADGSLRIDFQKPFNDPTEPGAQWANFQLQQGGDSHACVLLKMGLHYPAADVRDAWLASLQHARNARLVWRFVASKIEAAVLQALDRTPRTVVEIDREVRRRFGWGLFYVKGLEFHHGHLIDKRIPEALQQLVAAKLALKQPAGWVITPDGDRYLKTGPIPFAF